MAGGEQ